MDEYFKWTGAAILEMLSIISGNKIIKEKKCQKTYLHFS